MTLVVGITGGIGSGKSAVTDLLQQRGITIVDADMAARVVVEPGTPALAAIAEHFGNSVLQADGGLDRAALRALVFADAEQRHWLEQLTHPLIGEEIRRQLSASGSAYTVLSSPLLFESSQRELVDVTVVVDLPEELQLERAMQRDSNSEEQIQRIMAAQMSRPERLRHADIVVDNSGNLDALEEKVETLHRQLLARAGQQL